MSLILSGSDGLSDIDGTAATPAIRGTDANTGIFFGSDIIGFSEGGTEAMRINASGVLVTTNDASISGLTVGKGAGAISTNTALGGDALVANTTGSVNTAIGYQAAYSNTTGASITAVGYKALYASTGNNNTAIGKEAGLSTTTGTNNAFFGAFSAYANTTGASNVALGYEALQANTTAGNNTAVGYQAGYSNTTGAYSTFIGDRAGYNTTTGSYCTALGTEALRSNTTGRNTAIGTNAGYGITTGTFNQCFGDNAGASVTTGSKNSILGCYNGNQGGLDIRTASNYIVLSDGDGNPRFQINSSGNLFAPAVSLTVSTAVSAAAIGTDDVGLLFISASGQKRIIPRKPNDPGAASDNLIDLGDAGSRYRVIFAGTGTINTSDANEKQQVRDLNVAEKAVATRIKGLIKAYKFNDAVAIKGDNARIHIGVLAQEVAAAFEAEGLDAHKYSMFCSDTWYEVDGNTIDDQNKFVTKDNPNAVARTRLGIRYDELLAFVISAL
jgi:hypothetical protein